MTQFEAPEGLSGAIKADLIDVVHAANRGAPRSLQRHIGPSELGVTCMRRLAYASSVDIPRGSQLTDPWFAIVGTAVHSWLGAALEGANLDNARKGRDYANDRRYLVEERVTASIPNYSVSGTLDVYDVDRCTVIDHKVVGPSKIKEYKASGPSNQYRVQVHTYGLGIAQKGYDVKQVALAFYPRNGYLSDMFVWAEAFDNALATKALSRALSVQTMTEKLASLEGGWELIPATPGSDCTYCPFYRPELTTASAAGCPGKGNA